MKRILITGADSYVGTCFEKYITENFEGYAIDTLDMRTAAWRDASFGGYDAVFHVAGIAHADMGAVTPEREALYYAVNTVLAIATAKADERVAPFIEGKTIVKEISVPNRIVNIVVR